MKHKILKVLNSYVEHPRSLLIGWFFFLSLPLANYFRYILITNQVYLPTMLRYSLYLFAYSLRIVLPGYCLIILVLWLIKFSNRLVPTSHRKVLHFMAISAAVLFFFNNYLLRLEESNYANYLYIRYGLQVSLLQDINQIHLLVLSLVIFLLVNGGRLFALTPQKTRGLKNDLLKNGLLYLVLIIFVFILSRSFFPIVDFASHDTVAHITYEESFGTEFKNIKLLQTTPKDARLIHPPQKMEWPLLGNQPMIRYFLFPRTLVSGKVLIDQNKVNQIFSAYFVSIFPDDSVKTWPLISTQSASITFDTLHPVQYSALIPIAKKEDSVLYQVFFYEQN